MPQAVIMQKRGPEIEESIEESAVREKSRHQVKKWIAVQEAADEEKGHENMTDLQIHSHSTRTLAGGELCAATESICNMFWEIQQNLTAGRALCEYVTPWWQAGKHLS